jgi:hypothetical protein
MADLLPFPEYRPDVADYRGASTKTATNVVPRADGYGPFRNFVAFTAALPEACRGFFYARKADGSVAIFAGTASKLYLLDNTDFEWSDVSLDADDYATLPTAYHWQFAQFGNFVIAVQPNVVPQMFDLSSSSAFAELGGSPPQASYISIVGRFVVLSGLLNNPYRVQWSGLNAATTWTSGVNSSDYQDLPDGGIVRGVGGGEFGVIFQETAMRRMIYVPGSPLIFQIERITEDKGLHAPYSLIRAGDRLFFLASQGFHAIGGGGLPEPIGKERFDRTFFEDYDSGNIQLVIGAADPQESRVYWAYKSRNGTAGQFDRMIVWDHVLGRASRIEMAGEYLATMARPGVTLEGLDDILDNIDELAFSLDDVSTAALSKVAAFGSGHNLGFYTGETLEAVIETAEQTLGRRMRVQGARPITDAATCTVAISGRERTQDEPAASAEQAVDARGFAPANVSTRLARGRLHVPAGEAWTYAIGIEPAFKQEGSR